MTILSAIRDRFSTRDSSGLQVEDAQGEPVAEAGLPFAGYDRLDDRQVVEALSDHSQLELDAVESYERSHQNRQRVLDKLRYMRQREPLPGYDALSVEEIVSALEEADLATISKVRGYERKFAHRPDVLEEVARVYPPASGKPTRKRGARLPADEQNVGRESRRRSASGASPGGDRPVRSGRP